MTRTTLRDRVRKKLGETTSTFWSDDELNTWMEDAQTDIVWRAKLKRTRGTFTTVSGQGRYTLTTEFPSFFRVVNGGVWIYDSDNWRRLEYMSKDDMDNLHNDWVNADEGAPMYYMEDSGEDVIELWPPPDTDHAGTDYCRVYYSATPTAMVVDTDEPDLDTQQILHPAVIDWVCATGFESRGYWDLAQTCWSNYAGKIKAWIVEKNNKEDEEIIMKSIYNI